MQIRIIGDISSVIAWAKKHEIDRLWAVSWVRPPYWSTVHYRLLNDAIKAAGERSGAEKVWFRREHDDVYDGPVLSCRVGTGFSNETVAFVSAILLGFELPAVSGPVDGPIVVGIKHS